MSNFLPVKKVLIWLPRLLVPCAAFPALSFLVPSLNPSLRQGADLSGALAQAAYWTAESGGVFGMPFVIIGMTALLVSRPGLRWKQRRTEAPAILLVIATMLAGGAFVNEHLIKPLFAIPRPNILELAENNVLGMSAEEFYALPNKPARSDHLRQMLPTDLFLSNRVREHWIAETGYSFPSGHSFSAILCAAFFLAMGKSTCTGWRLRIVSLLPVWAVAVCLSRPILRVHSPTDITVGAIEGVVIGLLAFILVRELLAVLSSSLFQPEQPC